MKTGKTVKGDNFPIMKKKTCECGCKQFREIATGFQSYSGNNPNMISIVECCKCKKIYNENQYDKLPRT